MSSQSALYKKALAVLLLVALCFDSSPLTSAATVQQHTIHAGSSATDPLGTVAANRDDQRTAKQDGLKQLSIDTGSDAGKEKDPAVEAVEQFFLEPRTTAFSVTDAKDEPRETSTTTTTEMPASAAASRRPAQSSFKQAPISSLSSTSSTDARAPFGDLAHVIGPATERTVRLSNANNEFAFRLAKALIKSSPQRNIFFSPLTLFSTLITIRSGATGNTRTQLDAALGLDQLTTTTSTVDGTQIEHGFRDLLHSLEKEAKGDQNSLKMLNALFIDKQNKVSTAFTDRARTYFNAYIEKVGFGSEPEYVLGWVNKLVAWWTEDHIKTLLDHAPDPLTKLLLVNAVFFRGKWANTFERRFTQDEPFTNADGRQSTVSMMKRTESFQVFCDNTTHHMCAIELLYSGDALSFLVLLPSSGHDLSELDTALNTQTMYDMISRLEERTLELGLPRFNMSTSYDLQQPLQDLGIIDVFTPTEADLSPMTNTTTSTLFVSEMQHKNVLEVNEEGTVAAGAAFASIGNRRKPSRLYVNRPFLFLVRDLRTDAILFLGRVAHLP